MLNREEYEHMMFDMMEHAAKAKEIGDKIANELAPKAMMNYTTFSIKYRTAR